MTGTPPERDEAARRRRQRAKNLMVAGIIVALCALFYAMTIVRMGRL